jgi:hypothetical protein
MVSEYIYMKKYVFYTSDRPEIKIWSPLRGALRGSPQYKAERGLIINNEI